jgi:hypothetical protein
MDPEGGLSILWNPFASDADCFRMETAVGISAVTCNSYVYASAREAYAAEDYSDHANDRNAARRRASTECAARVQMAREMGDG